MLRNRLILIFTLLISISLLISYFTANIDLSTAYFSNLILKTRVNTDTIQPVVTNQGNPFISHYKSDYSNSIWAITQDNLDQMVFAGRQGISIFNGNAWNTLKLGNIPLVVKNLAERNIILVGCDNQFGYLKYDENGEYNYTVLSDSSLNYGEITNVELSNSFIYFYSDKVISVFNRETLAKEYDLFAEITYNGILLFDDKLLVFEKGSGLYTLDEKGERKPISRTKHIAGEDIIFSIMLPDNLMLFGTSSNDLYVFDGENVTKYSSQIDKYISDIQLVSGIALSDNKFALGTLSSGVIVIDSKTNKIVHIINYQNGLPDDEIMSMFSDAYGNLWLSHGLGISKVNFGLPVKDYNSYPGIEGAIFDVIKLENTIYVATNEGVYYLDTLKSVKEKEFYREKLTERKVRLKSKRKIKPVPFLSKPKDKKKKPDIKTKPAKEKPTQRKKKKNIFQRFKEKITKRRKHKKRKQQIARNQDEGDISNIKQQQHVDNKGVGLSGEKKTLFEQNNKKLITDLKKNANNKRRNKKSKVKYITKERQILTISFAFKKIEGINNKCKKLVSHNNSILAATNNGVFEIKNNKAVKILSEGHVNTIVASKTPDVFYIGTNNGFTSIKFTGKKWKEYRTVSETELEEPVFGILEDSVGVLWLASNNVIYRVNTLQEDAEQENISSFNIDKDDFAIRCINKSIFVVSRDSICEYNPDTDKIEPSRSVLDSSCTNIKYIASQEHITWLGFDTRWRVFGNNAIKKEQRQLISLFQNVSNIKIDNENNVWVIDGNTKLYKISQSNVPMSYFTQFKVYIQSMHTNDGERINLSDIRIGENVNSITFKINAPYYIRPQEIEYQYILKPKMTEWSEWKKAPEVDLIPYSGSHTLQLRARNVFYNVSESKEYSIYVETHIWEELWFIVVVAIFLTALFFILLMFKQRRKQKKLQKYNITLENEVKKRTAEIKRQKNQIQNKNQQITHSLNYASQIQSAILPNFNTVDHAFSDYFILNKPRDIVSGDFYWLYKIGNKVAVAVGDCTGHGVPGAFLSIMGVNFLNEIVVKLDVLHADTILNTLRDRIVKTLNQDGYGKKRLDGMDLALVIYDTETNELEYAGANNSLYIVRDNFLTEIKADNMPVGLHFTDMPPFKNNIISLQKNDSLYLFSDGYMDQFGGAKGKKFLTKNFKEFVELVSSLPMEEQKKQLNDTFYEWKGSYAQLDDIMIIGLKV